MQAAGINADDFTQADFYESDARDLLAKAQAFSVFLNQWKGKGTYSYHRINTSGSGSRAVIFEVGTGRLRRMVSMASNNYLGLNTRPEVTWAAQEAVRKYGSGLCGSRFLSGTYDLVVELERRLADFEQRADAVVFTSGYQANVGALSALLRPGDLMVFDRLSHASIVDGCRLAGCAFRSFRHNDPGHLEALLRRYARGHRATLVVAETVFSMDGDLAPLPELVAAARKHGARVMVDEAHGTGVLGPTGRGAVEHFGLEDQVDIVLGTFSKALASTGGFIAASREVTDYVRHYARSYIFSASPTPASVASVLAALAILRTEPDLRRRLWDNIRYFHAALKALGFDVRPAAPESAILSIVAGADPVVRAVSRAVYEHGLFCGSAAYPAVPKNEGRLRLSVSAEHTRFDLDHALEILARAGREHGLL